MAAAFPAESASSTGKRLLLVLGNREHLLDACAVLASTLIKACPDLHALATSQQALGVGTAAVVKRGRYLRFG